MEDIETMTKVQSSKLSSTKVQGFWFFAIVATTALFADKLDGGSYVAITSLIFGIFSTANVAQKKVLQ